MKCCTSVAKTVLEVEKRTATTPHTKQTVCRFSSKSMVFFESKICNNYFRIRKISSFRHSKLRNGNLVKSPLRIWLKNGNSIKWKNNQEFSVRSFKNGIPFYRECTVFPVKDMVLRGVLMAIIFLISENSILVFFSDIF